MGGLMVSLIINDDEEMLVDYNLIRGSDGIILQHFMEVRLNFGRLVINIIKKKRNDSNGGKIY